MDTRVNCEKLWLTAACDIMVTAPENNNQARYVMPRCGQLRAGKGLTKSELAGLAKVDRTTLSRIERGEPVKIETAMSVFNALAEKWGGTLVADKEVLSQVGSTEAQ